MFDESNVQLRGLWEWISVLAIALVVTLISLYGLWQSLVNWFTLLHIHINLAGYVFVSVGFFAIWVTSVFLFDRPDLHDHFGWPGALVRDEIGQAEKVYDVTNMTFQLQPNVFFRHRVLGFYGAGDLSGTNRRTPFGCSGVAQCPFRSIATDRDSGTAQSREVV